MSNEQIRADSPSDQYFNDLAKIVFEQQVGRAHPWEGVQYWVIAAMRDAYNYGEKSAHARYAKSHEALEQELSVMHAAVASYSSPAEALKALIDWHVQVALDPKVNGGKVLVEEGEISGLYAACDKAAATRMAILRAAAEEP